MKKIRFSLPVAAFVLAIGASAFTSKSIDQPQATGWFEVDPNTGTLLKNPYRPIDPSNCIGLNQYCAKEYQLNSQGQPIESQPTGDVRMKN